MPLSLGALRKEVWGGTLFATLGLGSITLILLMSDIHAVSDNLLPFFIGLCVVIFFVDPWLRRFLTVGKAGLVLLEIYIFLSHFALLFTMKNFLADPQTALRDPRQLAMFLIYLVPIFSAAFSYGIRGSLLTCLGMGGLYGLSLLGYVYDGADPLWAERWGNLLLGLLPVFLLLLILAMMVGLMSEIKSRSERAIHDRISKVSTLDQMQELMRDSIYYENLWKHLLTLATFVIPSELGLIIEFKAANGPEYRIKGSHGTRKIFLEALLLPDGTPLLEAIRAQGDLVRWERLHKLAHLRRRPELKFIHSLLVAPLREGKRVSGALLLANPTTTRYYREAERDLLAVFINQVQFALDNARLYREAEVTSQRLRFILRSISSGVISCDRRGEVLAVNEAALELLRYRREEMVGKVLGTDLYLFRGADLLLNTLTAGTSYSSEPAPMVAKDHHEFEAGISTWKLRDDAGRDIGAIAVFKDLSEWNRLQRDLEDKRRLAELGQLAAGMAHELRNPLGGVNGFASLLRRELDDRPAAKALTEKIISGVASASKVLDQFLALTEDRPLLYRPLDTREFLSGQVAALAVEAAGRGVALAVREPVTPPSFKADPLVLQQVVQILLRNALEASVSGGAVAIGAELDSARGELRLTVSDRGVGIPADQVQKIFTPFFTTKGQQGTGMGLAVARRHVQALRGRIEVVSEVGRGSTFTVFLPAE